LNGRARTEEAKGGPMGKTIGLTASDGHSFSVFEASPTGKPRGGLVVIQEIFGVNEHIRAVTDGYAAEGYYCVAPALFDREAPGLEYGYGPEVFEIVRPLTQKIGMDKMLLDVEAACVAAASAGKVGVVGYCLGGSLAWLAATRVQGVAAASCYYGGRIAASADEKPRCPVQMHFGEKDQSIPLTDVDKIRAAVPSSVEIFVYPAGHAFNRDVSQNYEPASAKLARERTLALLRKYVG
jgi:carboxymethylenebutenolidase